MPENDTLLAHLVLDLRLFGQVEVAATRSLAYILNKSDSAMSTMVKLINSQTGAELDPFMGIVAEDAYQAEGGSGRIDFVGYDANSEKRIVGEAKFDAAISAGQGGGYLHQLAKNGPAVLIFVVPDYRIDYLWGEVRKDVEMTGAGAILGETDVQGRVKSCKVEYGDANWHLMMVSWRELIDGLVEGSSDEDHVVSDILQLRGLTERMDAEAFQELKEEDLGTEFPRRLLRLTRLIDTVVDAYGVQEGLLQLQGYRATASFDGFVRYFEFVESGVKSWFGFSYRRWSGNDSSPLWFGLQGPVANKQINQGIYTEIMWALHDKFNGLEDGSVPIRLRTEADYQEVLNQVVDQLKSIEEGLKQYTAAT